MTIPYIINGLMWLYPICLFYTFTDCTYVCFMPSLTVHMSDLYLHWLYICLFYTFTDCTYVCFIPSLIVHMSVLCLHWLCICLFYTFTDCTYVCFIPSMTTFSGDESTNYAFLILYINWLFTFCATLPNLDALSFVHPLNVFILCY